MLEPRTCTPADSISLFVVRVLASFSLGGAPLRQVSERHRQLLAIVTVACGGCNNYQSVGFKPRKCISQCSGGQRADISSPGVKVPKAVLPAECLWGESVLCLLQLPVAVSYFGSRLHSYHLCLCGHTCLLFCVCQIPFW